MSKCQNCLQGMCRRHPLQDHGERAAKLQLMAKESQKANIATLLQSQISRLEAESRANEVDNDAFKMELNMEREKLSKKRKSSSYSKGINPEKAAKYASSGLNPSVLSMMMEDSDDDGNGNLSDDSSSSSSLEDRKKSKKYKKDKKEKKEKKKKYKKESKSSDSKKRKDKRSKDGKDSKSKSKKHRKEEEQHNTSSSSSSSSSEDER
mmetsp:Transcript_94966/g.186353  ORF Transcript_94966/g.186353 Transcript_94966/m.186353 type:complete len:207 (+) Transcript_94966:65-685(+)